MLIGVRQLRCTVSSCRHSKSTASETKKKKKKKRSPIVSNRAKVD